jgi:hypothetical protein
MIGRMSRPSILGGLLATLACLLLPLAVLSTWTATVVGDTDAYVDTVAPLAKDPVVQEAAAARTVELVNEQVPLGPAGPAVHQAALLAVEGPQFPPVWRAANRDAHKELLRILQSDRPAKGDVTIQLGGLVTAIAESLGAGQLASTVSALNPTFTVASSQQLEHARQVYTVLEALGAWLPLAWVVLVLLALLAARNRRRIGAWLGIGSAVTLGLLLALLTLFEDQLVQSVPARDRDLAQAVWDVVTHDLRNGVVVGIAVGLAVAVLFMVSGLVRRSAPARTP